MKKEMQTMTDIKLYISQEASSRIKSLDNAHLVIYALLLLRLGYRNIILHQHHAVSAKVSVSLFKTNEMSSSRIVQIWILHKESSMVAVIP